MAKAFPHLKRQRHKRETSPAFYRHLWATARALPEHAPVIIHATHKILTHRTLYAKTEQLTGIPWAIIGAIHYRECSCNPGGSIQDGSPWRNLSPRKKRTPPRFESFEDATEDALFNWPNPSTWTAPLAAEWIERHNGMGYANKGLNSPYLWSMTQHGIGVGKYVADGVYDPDAIDKQVGAMTLLLVLNRIDWIDLP